MSTINLSHAEKMHKLFVSYDKNFIEQFADGTYRTYSDGSQFLGIDYINEHLKGTRTFGVLESVSTRFMSFDIDDDNKLLVKAIIWLLRKYEFPDNAIQVNLSGKKGYHIHVFLDLPVELSQCTLIQHCVLYDLRDLHPELSILKVELRPLPGKGIKLPLGIHRVTGNRCWFCDKETLEPIEDFNYIHNIYPAPRELFSLSYMNLIYRNSRDRILQRVFNLKGYKRRESVAPHHEDSPHRILSSTTIDSIGTRHDTLLDLCVKLFCVGVPYDKCLSMTRAWMDAQDKSNYSSPAYECNADINKTVKSVYDKLTVASHTMPSQTILKRSEMNFVLTLRPSSTQKPTLSFMKVLLYFLTEHRDNSGALSTNWRAHATSSICRKAEIKSNDTVRKHIIALIELGYLEMSKGKITSQNFFYNLYGNPANEYCLTQKLIDELAEFESADTGNKTFVVQRSSSTDKTLRDAANALFERKELKSMLTRSQYETICLMKESA